MPVALEEVLATFTIKDQASKVYKKLKVQNAEAKQGFLAVEKQVEKTDKSLSGFGAKAAKKQKTEGRKKTEAAGKGIGGTIENIAGGGGLEAGLSAIAGALPYGLGAVIMAPIIAMKMATTRFVQGVALQQELGKIANDFNQSFSEKARNALSSVDSFFESDDLKKAFSSLSETGIDPKTIEGSAKTLTEFAKSQGLQSLTEGINALQSGTIKYGRGLKESDIRQLQALAPALQEGGIAAESAFRVMTKILERNSATMGKAADATEKNIGGIQRVQNTITATEKSAATDILRTGEGVKEGLESYQAGKAVEKRVNRVIDYVGQKSGTAVGKLEKRFGGSDESPTGKRAGGGNVLKNRPVLVGENGPEKFTPWTSGDVTNQSQNRKRAGGGNVLKNRPVLVGENGPEKFTPWTSGDVTNQSQNRNGVGITSPTTVSNIQNFYNSFYIKIEGGNGMAADNIQRAVKNALNDLSKTTFRQASGLPMRG